MQDERTETLPGGALQAKKSPKDVIGWAGFAVTAALLLYMVYYHGTNLWYYCFGAGRPIFSMFNNPEFTALERTVTIVSILRTALFLVYPVVLLALMPLRKRFVPAMLVAFAIAAISFNIVGQIEALLLMARYNTPVVRWTSLLYLALEAALLVFYLKSKRFRVIFNK